MGQPTLWLASGHLMLGDRAVSPETIAPFFEYIPSDANVVFSYCKMSEMTGPYDDPDDFIVLAREQGRFGAAFIVKFSFTRSITPIQRRWREHRACQRALALFMGGHRRLGRDPWLHLVLDALCEPELRSLMGRHLSPALS